MSAGPHSFSGGSRREPILSCLFQGLGVIGLRAPFHLQWLVGSLSHGASLACLCLPHLKTPVITVHPPGSSRVISLSPGQLVSNVNSTCKLNSLLSCNLTHSQSLRTRMWTSLGGCYSACNLYVHCRKFGNTEKT